MAARKAPAADRWVVACDVTIVGPFRSEESALRRLEAIEQIGGCRSAHEVRVATPADLEEARR